MARISIIIPAYNEEQRIEQTLLDYSRFFGRNYGDYEIIVVTDGTQDGTDKIVEGISKKDSRIKLLNFSRRLGKGGAIFKGFEKASGEIVGFTDADASVSPKEFNKLIIALPDYDCVAGSRYAKGAIQLKKQPLSVRIASRIFNILVNLLFGLDMRDTQCGAKVFRRNVIKRVIPHMVTKDFSFDVELLWRINKIGRIKEEPLIWEHKQHASKSALRNSPKMLFSILRARLSGN